MSLKPVLKQMILEKVYNYIQHEVVEAQQVLIHTATTGVGGAVRPGEGTRLKRK